MSHIDSNKAGRLPSARMLVLALGTVLAFSGTELSAQEQTSEPHHAETGVAYHTLAGLEQAFWLCDHAATIYGVLDADTAAACAAATTEFRLKKFNDDFHAMLSWWQRHKARQHELLDARYRAAAHR